MNENAPTPIDRDAVADLYFMEHRAKVLDIAAFLDRLDRAPGGKAGDDFRVRALRDAICVLIDGSPHRARRIQELLSDRSEAPIDAATEQGAHGAPRR